MSKQGDQVPEIFRIGPEINHLALKFGIIFHTPEF